MGKTAVEHPDYGVCSEETGTGFVNKPPDRRGRNVHVEVRADHLRLPVGGWADGHGPLANILGTIGVGTRVRYRILVHAKADHVGTPLEQLAPDQKVRDLVELERLDAGGMDPAANGHQVPTEVVTMPEGALDPPAGSILDAGRENTAHRQELRQREAARNEPAPDPVDEPEPQPEPPADRPAGDATAPPDPPPVRRGPRIAEDKPWEPANTDGSPNRGSYEFAAATWAADAALYSFRSREPSDPFDDDNADKDGPPPPDWPRIRGVAKWLIKAADQVQANVRADGYADRMANSHARARRAVDQILRVHPIPWSARGDLDVIRDWHANVIADATELLRVAIACLEVDLP